MRFAFIGNFLNFGFLDFVIYFGFVFIKRFF